MAKKELVALSGLWTHPNAYSEVPQGSLDIAANIVIDRPRLAESRRGFKQFLDALAAPEQLLEFQALLLAHDDSTFYYEDTSWTALTGTYEAPADDLKVQNAKLTNAMFATTDAGLIRFDAPDEDPRAAGFPPALDGTGAPSGSGSGWFTGSTWVTYRIVWGRRTASGQLILGAPSARISIENSGADDTADLTFTVPEGIEEGDFFQLYRSELAATADTSDELQLTVQRAVDNTDISAGVVTVTDAVDEDSKGAFLYTSPSQEGILQSNDRPPFMRDVVEFRQHLFGLATVQRHEVLLTWQEQPAVNDTIKVGSLILTAKAAETIASKEFKIESTLIDTMRSFIRVLNRTTDNSLYYAYELQGASMRIDVRGLTDTGFAIASSNDDLFDLTDPDSAQEAAPYRVHISKPSEGDAWPRTSFLDQGSVQGRRLIALRDVVFCMMDDGVYRITGTDNDNWVSEVHDSTVVIKGANTAVPLNNEVFMVTNRGVISLSMNGLDEQIGEPIQTDILRFVQLDNWDSLAFGVAYEQDQKYVLWVPMTEEDETATRAYVLNYETRQWTWWDIAATCAIERSSPNLLYIGRSDGQVVEERKSFTLQDFADDEFSVTITTSSGDQVTVASVTDVVVGMTLQQDNAQAVITAINSLVLTVDRPLEAWENGDATVFTPIPIQLRLVRFPSGQVGSYKHFAEVAFSFANAGFNMIDATFQTDVSGGQIDVALQSRALDGWGEFSWPEDEDETEWGGSYGGPQVIPTYVPRDCSLGSWLSLGLRLEEAFTSLSLEAIELQLYGTQGRVR